MAAAGSMAEAGLIAREAGLTVVVAGAAGSTGAAEAEAAGSIVGSQLWRNRSDALFDADA